MRFIHLLGLSLIIGLGGCSLKPQKFLHPTADFQYIKKVAVLPLNNLSDDKYAGEKVRSTVIMELLQKGKIEVTEEGEANKAATEVFREMGRVEGELVSIDARAVKKISESLGVQAVLMGVVESYGQTRGSGPPRSQVSLSLSLVDGETGITLWRGSFSERGNSLFRSLAGVDQRDEYELSRSVVRELLHTLLSRLG